MIRFTLLITIFLLSGCGIGGFWMNGDPSVGRNLKPYGAHWIKEGMTRESRLNDFVMCGGGKDLREGYESMPNQSHKDFFKAFNSHTIDVLNCMKSKGYAYFPECDDRCLYP